MKSLSFFKQAMLAGLSLSALAACSSTKTGESVQRGADFSRDVVSQTGAGLGDAALSPLEDLNLRRDEIPAFFSTFRTPYDTILVEDCAVIATEVQTLDTLLKTDFDVQLEQLLRKIEADGDGDLANNASDFALDMVASEARGLIPFRGVIRQASGASKHEKKREAAYEKAYLRRAYLKGLGQGLGCTYPAAPYPVDYDALDKLEQTPIEYRGTKPD